MSATKAANTIGPVARLFRSLADKIGIDAAITYTILSKSWSIFAGPVMLFLIVTRLTPNEQGYYYTFSSTVGLRVLFELGFGFVIVQFVSHESAHLRLIDGTRLEGEVEPLQRLGSFFRTALKTYALLGLAAFVVILCAGVWLFGSAKAAPGEAVNWLVPWLLLCVLTSVNFFLGCLMAVVEGLGMVAEINRVRFYEGMVSNLGAWAILISGGKLYAVVAAPLVGAMLVGGWVLWCYAPVLRQMWAQGAAGCRTDWMTEVWPFQWKLAVSTGSGYLIFQIINPILFKFRGPVEAGRMGLSMAFIGIVGQFAYAWISTKNVIFSQCVGRRDWGMLDRVFFRAVKNSMMLLVLGYGLMIGMVCGLSYFGSPLYARLAPTHVFVLLALTQTINHLSLAQAAYLRAHRIEPFMITSIIGGVSILIVGLTLARWYGIEGAAVGSFVTTLGIGLVWGTSIFIRRRKVLHAHRPA